MTRPFPPLPLLESFQGKFLPAPELADWVKETFIDDNALLMNEDHEHLRSADIGFLWTNIENVRRGRLILGQCQIMPPGGEKWAAGRSSTQIESWFGGMPDFMITLFAPAAVEMDHATFMALVEHELYHAAQARDKFGNPAFEKATGRPVWTTRAHDVEEFVGVVRRYGADASGTRELVAAANRGPEIAAAKIERACGTCLRLVN